MGHCNTYVSQTALDARAIQDTLVDVFERVGNVFRRLETHVEVPLTTEMVDIVIRIMVEVLSILAIAMKEIRHGPLSEQFLYKYDTTEHCSEKYVKKLVGRTDIEDALQRLDKLTRDEARMAIVQVLKATHAVDYRTKEVVDKAFDVSDKVAGIDYRVAGVDSRAMGGDSRVLTVGNGVKAIHEKDTEVIDGAQPIFPGSTFGVSCILSASLSEWLSPPDQKVNHNIACKARHKGASNWFLQSRTFERWNSEGSLLWIHGKRNLYLFFCIHGLTAHGLPSLQRARAKASSGSFSSATTVQRN